jgi:hypothetical protein
MATFPLDPDRILNTSETFDILVSKPKGSREIRRARGTTGLPRKSFTLFFDHISFANKETILGFFEARRGEWESFTWNQPAAPIGDGAAYTVRFGKPLLEATKVLGGTDHPRYQMTISLIEVL